MPHDVDARRYYRAGKQRLDEAELILWQVKLPAASIYLAGYSVECLLKALLVERTAETNRAALVASLKGQFGHNLDWLRNGLVDRGVAVPTDVLSDLVMMATWSPELRYEPGPGNARAADLFLRAANRIVTWTDGSI